MLHVQPQALEYSLFGRVKLPEIIVSDGVEKPILGEVSGIEPQQLVCCVGQLLPLFFSQSHLSKLGVGRDHLGIRCKCLMKGLSRGICIPLL